MYNIAEKPRASREPRWPALVGIAIVALVYAALPPNIAVGPRWLMVVIVGVLEIPTLIFHFRGHANKYRVLGYIISGIMTLFVIWSVVLLLMALPDKKEPAAALLRSAGLLWVANIVVFSLWYWRLDGGGPTARERMPGHTEGAFLFPQMTLKISQTHWSPLYVDYLFLAFNTSTAFSPTDCPILSRWAKVLSMIQGLISLSLIAVLAARAVNMM